MQPDRLSQQVRFIEELEQLKAVYRRNVIVDRSRQESTAEHSWSLAMMVMLLAEHCPVAVDRSRAISIALVHDIVEIDAGDTFAHDVAAQAGRQQREQQAADRLFSMLPSAQGRDLRRLWDEFEAGQTAEARFVRVVDRLQPLLLHRLTGGAAWQLHGVTEVQVRRRMAEVKANAPAFWPLAERVIKEAVERGQLT